MARRPIERNRIVSIPAKNISRPLPPCPPPLHTLPAPPAPRMFPPPVPDRLPISATIDPVVPIPPRDLIRPASARYLRISIGRRTHIVPIAAVERNPPGRSRGIERI